LVASASGFSAADGAEQFSRVDSGTRTQNLRGTGDNKRSEFAMTASKGWSTN
jgi:hypothetical protein